jgi:putative methionine-R-sulfoxide reductase with GAF domain
MTAPLLAGKEVVGVINLESTDRAAFSSEDLRLLCQVLVTH